MSATLSSEALAPNAGSGVTREPGAVAFDVDRQHADAIYQAGRDQYISNRHELVIEPMRRRARVLLRLGNALILTGVGAALLVTFMFAGKVGDFVDSVGPAIDAQSTDSLVWPPFGVLLAVPLGAVAAFAGLVFVLFSVSMRRRARREAELA